MPLPSITVFRWSPLVAVLALAMHTVPAAAQCTSLTSPCTNEAPYVGIDPGSAIVQTQSIAVGISWADVSGLNYTTRSIRLNGVDVSGGFTHENTLTTSASTGSVVLQSGSNLLVAEICDMQGLCAPASATYQYEAPPAVQPYGPPIVSLAPFSQDVRPQPSVDAVVAHTTPAYVSRDVARSATLLFTGTQARGYGSVQVDVRDNSTNAPSHFSILVRDSVTNVVVATETFYIAAPAVQNRLFAWWTTTEPTGARTYAVVVRTHWPTEVRETVKYVRVLILNERQSPFGRGWTLAGLQRIHKGPAGVMVADGAGSAVFFRRFGASFIAPDGEFSSLSRNGTTFVRRFPDGTEAVFDSVSGRLNLVKDRFDQTVTYTYGAGSRLEAITDPIGKVTTFGYDANGKIASITDPAGRTTLFTVTSATLVTIRDPDGVVAMDAAYITNGTRLNRRTDRNGATWNYQYDAVGLPYADTLPPITVNGTVQRPVANYRTWERAARGGSSIATAVAPVDGGALRTLFINPRGQRTRVGYDRFGSPRIIEAPYGHTTVIQRNEHGQPTLVVEPNGSKTGYTWDGPRLTTIYDYQLEKTTTIAYAHPYNLPERVTDGGVQVRYEYGTRGELLRQIVVSDTVKYGYTPDWRLSNIIDPSGRTTSRFYESGGALNTWYVRDVDSNGAMRQTNYTYDAFGRPASVTSASETVQYQYDVLNRDTLVIDPLGGSTRFRYTGSRLSSVVDPVGKQYQYVRNFLGWVEKEIDPQGRETLYGYDAVGNVTARINHRSQLVSMAYDSLNRVLSRTADGATTTYGYDGPQGRWVSAANPESTDTIRFDARGRQTQALTAMGGAVFNLLSSYAFDEAPRSGLTYSGPGYTSTIGFRYNTGLQLDRISGPAGLADTTTLHYDRGLLTRIRLPTGLEQTFEYTPAHMLKRSRWSSSTVDNQLGWRYGWYTQDRQASRMNAQENQWRRYAYDALGRIRGASNYTKEEGDFICEDPMVPSTCYLQKVWVMQDTTPYTYDAVGNRTGMATSMEPNSNRYSYFNFNSHAYDLDGNQTLKQGGGITQSYTWNSLGQLTSVTRNGAMVFYGYDGWGRRVRRTDGSGSIRYVYDGDDLLLEVDGAGNRLREYLHYPGIDRPHSVRVWANGMGGARYFYAMEYPGHVTGLANSTAAVANTYRYDPWGQAEATNEAVHQPLRYMARELDPLTGLYYVRNRWYDPQMQRFISEDPIGLAGGINIYAYAANSPTNARDPLGLAPDNASFHACALELANNNPGRRISRQMIRASCGSGSGAFLLSGLTVVAQASDPFALIDELIRQTDAKNVPPPPFPDIAGGYGEAPEDGPILGTLACYAAYATARAAGDRVRSLQSQLSVFRQQLAFYNSEGRYLSPEWIEKRNQITDTERALARALNESKGIAAGGTAACVGALLVPTI